MKKMYQRKVAVNQLKTEFFALSENEGLARSVVCAFAAQCGPSVSELADVRCAVSEAVTNAIVHGYAARGGKNTVYIHTTLYADRSIRIVVRDKGRGIEDIAKAMEPLYTTDETGERSGMGFSIMQSFMDSVRVLSRPGLGTSVMMKKTFAKKDGKD